MIHSVSEMTDDATGIIRRTKHIIPIATGMTFCDKSMCVLDRHMVRARLGMCQGVMRSIVRRKRKMDPPNTTSQYDSGISCRPTHVTRDMIDMPHPMQ